MLSTLAWFTPTKPGRRSYRESKLKIILDGGDDQLGIGTNGLPQPDHNRVEKGTLVHKRWSNIRTANISKRDELTLTVQRKSGADLYDEPIKFALITNIAIPNLNTIYSEVKNQIQLRQRPRPRV